MVTITLQLPEDVVQKAQSAGLLTNERLVQMIEAEVERQRKEAGERLEQAMEIVQNAAALKYAHLSEDEVMELVNQEIETMHAQKRAKEALERDAM